LKHNLYGNNEDLFNKAYRNRFIGFRSEAEFKKDFKGEIFYDGGFILPAQDSKATLHAPVYFTVSDDDPRNYNSLYKELSKFRFAKMLFVKYGNKDIRTWKTQDLLNIGNPLPIPEFEVFEYTNKGMVSTRSGISCLTGLFADKANPYKSPFDIEDRIKKECFDMLSTYHTKELVKIYTERLVFDGYLGYSKYRGIPSDIDLITLKNEKYYLLEVKEKDLSKGRNPGFGMDVRRMNDLETLQISTGLRFVYIVKHVNNQTERKKVGWYQISLASFIKHTVGNKHINGGAGMASVSDQHSTLVCKLHHFKTIKPPDS